MTTEQDLYQTLGLGRDASLEEIKKAFRVKSKESHPDKNPEDPTAEERFRAVALAYEVLKDPEARAAYDETGRIPSGFSARAMESRVEELLANEFLKLLQKDPTLPGNVVESMRRSLRVAVKNGEAAVGQNRAVLGDLEAARGRIRRDGQPEGVFENVLTNQIQQALEHVRQNEAQLEVHNLALERLALLEDGSPQAVEIILSGFTTSRRGGGFTYSSRED